MSENLAVHHHTLESYFFEEIEQVQDRRGRSLPREVEAYVVGLLARYAKRTHAAGRTARPLALEYMRARGEEGPARVSALRRVGDRALYISGVVPRSLDRGPVGVGYVKGIGEAAYREVSDRRSGGAAEVLGALAEMFDDVADVISDVVDGSRADDDLLALYERWRAGGSRDDLARLISAGVLIDTKASDTLQ